jgi:hypothetical protein
MIPCRTMSSGFINRTRWSSGSTLGRSAGQGAPGDERARRAYPMGLDCGSRLERDGERAPGPGAFRRWWSWAATAKSLA